LESKTHYIEDTAISNVVYDTAKLGGSVMVAKATGAGLFNKDFQQEGILPDFFSWCSLRGGRRTDSGAAEPQQSSACCSQCSGSGKDWVSISMNSKSSCFVTAILLPHGARANLLRARGRCARSFASGGRLRWGGGKGVRVAEPAQLLCCLGCEGTCLAERTKP